MAAVLIVCIMYWPGVSACLPALSAFYRSCVSCRTIGASQSLLEYADGRKDGQRQAHRQTDPDSQTVKSTPLLLLSWLPKRVIACCGRVAQSHLLPVLILIRASCKTLQLRLALCWPRPPPPSAVPNTRNGRSILPTLGPPPTDRPSVRQVDKNCKRTI